MAEEGGEGMLEGDVSSVAEAPWKMTGKWIGPSPREAMPAIAPLPTQSFSACPTGPNLSMNSPRIARVGEETYKESHTERDPAIAEKGGQTGKRIPG